MTEKPESNVLYLKDGQPNIYYWYFLIQTYYAKNLVRYYLDCSGYSDEEPLEMLLFDTGRCLPMFMAMLQRYNFKEEFCCAVVDAIIAQLDKREQYIDNEDAFDFDELLKLTIHYKKNVVIFDFPVKPVEEA